MVDAENVGEEVPLEEVALKEQPVMRTIPEIIEAVHREIASITGAPEYRIKIRITIE